MFKISYSKSKEFFNKLETRYYLFLAIPMVIIALSFLQKYAERTIVYDVQENLKWYVGSIVVIIFLIVLSFVNYNRKMNILKKSDDLREKLDGYSNGVLELNFRMQLLGLLTSIGFAITSDGVIGFCYIIVLVFSSSMRPNIHAIRRTLKLSKEEHQLLINDTIIE